MHSLVLMRVGNTDHQDRNSITEVDFGALGWVVLEAG